MFDLACQLTVILSAISGESGLGKSTLVNSMFMSDIYNNEYPGPSHRIKKTVAVSGSRRYDAEWNTRHAADLLSWEELRDGFVVQYM